MESEIIVRKNMTLTMKIMTFFLQHMMENVLL